MRWPHRKASMRPGQQAPESLWEFDSARISRTGFNEARAASPGILTSGVPRWRCFFGFNEARAASPGIRCRPGRLLRQPRCFNEARAASPGILIHKLEWNAKPRRFNEARAASPGIRRRTVRCRPLGHASMRPGQQAPESQVRS